jgi:hypothetical protein
LLDIQESIDNIDSFLKDVDFEVYQADLKTKSAVERQMQIISEPPVGFRIMERGCALGSIGKGCAEWATF